MCRRKLKIVIISLIAAFVTLLSQDTVAYYSVLGEAVSVVTSGEISIRISQKSGGHEIPEEVKYLMPGRVLSKETSVQNIGENPCWVRVKLKNGIEDEAILQNTVEIDINEEDWIDGKDGYYYYRRILKPNTETEPLFSQIKIAGTADNRYLGKNLKITITAYAVQSEYNDTVSSPLDVAGWPAEC